MNSTTNEILGRKSYLGYTLDFLSWNRTVGCWPVGFLFFFAALFKSLLIATTGGSWMDWVTVPLEILLFLLLTSGFRFEVVRVVTYLVLMIFLGVLLAKLFAGEKSCGCFGHLSPGPKFMLLVDSIAFSILVIWPVPEKIRLSVFNCSLVICLFLGSILAYPSFFINSVNNGADSNIFWIKPQSWVGQPFPVRGYLDDDSFLDEGEWTIVFHRSKCVRCAKLIDSVTREKSKLRFAFVELPPYESNKKFDSANLVWRRLSEDKTWLVQTPTIIVVENGIVTQSNRSIGLADNPIE